MSRYELSTCRRDHERRDHWASHAEAYQALRHNRLFKKFDAQCFEDYFASGIDLDAQKRWCDFNNSKTGRS